MEISAEVTSPIFCTTRSESLYHSLGAVKLGLRCRHGSGGEVVESYAILTTRPNPFLEPIHDRMPVILREAREQEWLESEEARVEHLLHSLEEPYPPKLLEAFPVSKQVNSPIFDLPSLVQRVNKLLHCTTGSRSASKIAAGHKNLDDQN